MSLSCKAVFLDISGVLYEGSHPIEGAADAVRRVREQGLLLRLVTNTATRSRQTIIADLQHMDISIEAEELFTAPSAAKRYIEKCQYRPFCLVHPAIKSEFSDLNQENPNCVLLGDAREDLNYQTLNQAFQLCKQHMPLIGIGMNKYFRENNSLMLDAGPFIRAIAWAADTNPIIMGKPNAQFFHQVVASTPYPANQCLMVGDDVTADVEAAINANLQGCLVKTGKYVPIDEQKAPKQAFILNSIADLIHLL